MSKWTLLELVQDILNDMDGDQVNSIDDTFESEQVASIVRSTYLAIISNRNWPHLKQFVQLESSGNPALPTHVNVPSNIKELVLLNYNKAKLGQTRKDYRPVRYLFPDEFLRKINARNSDSDSVDIITDPTGVELLIVNNQAPQHYTSFDDQTIVMDAYDSDVDTTIQESKIQATAYVNPVWVHQDDAIPDLPEEAFIALLEEAKSRSMVKLKQMVDEKAEQEARRQQRWLSRKAWTVNGSFRRPKLGRRGVKSPRQLIKRDNYQ